MARTLVLLAAALVAGCMKKVEEQTKPTGSILGKKTQDIGEYDPEAKRKVSKARVEYTDPVSGPMSALAYTLEEAPKLQIEHALNLYNAEHGRFPKTHKEFMDGIIKANNIELPVLPRGKQWQYDVKEHKLLAVERAEDPPANDPPN